MSVKCKDGTMKIARIWSSLKMKNIKPAWNWKLRAIEASREEESAAWLQSQKVVQQDCVDNNVANTRATHAKDDETAGETAKANQPTAEKNLYGEHSTSEHGLDFKGCNDGLEQPSSDTSKTSAGNADKLFSFFPKERRKEMAEDLP
jgi:hypothetical protein